jgi:hypothetical protein
MNAKELISKRKDRAIAIILSVKEKECDPYLSVDASHALRKTVLDQVNSLYDLTLDIIASMDSNGVELNQYYLDMISELHDAVIVDKD